MFMAGLYSPLEITQKTEDLWVIKWKNSFRRTVMLWLLWWMFVAMWAAFSINTMTWMWGVLPYWLMKFFWGLAFCLGLILVVLWGWELFTGNVLLVVAWLQKKVTTSQFLKNLLAVYIWNFIWALIIVALLYLWGFHALSNWDVWNLILKVSSHKLEWTFVSTLSMWILCNIYVCFALWLCYSGSTTSDKIIATIFPITAFAAIGFEHIVANMFYLPYGFILNLAEKHYEVFTISHIITSNVIPVTLWNLIGWSIFVWVIYWLLFCKYKKD